MSESESSTEVSTTSSRRAFVATGGAALTALSAGCSGMTNSIAGASKTTVTVLLTPAESPADVKKQYQPMVKYLENSVSGISITVDVATDYSAIWPAIRSGQANIAFDDVTLIQFPDKVDVLGTSVTANTAYYFSMLLVQADSDIQSLDDLQGTSISFCDPLSTSGSIYPLSALKQAGLDIGDAPTGKPVDFKGSWSNHDTSLQQLFNREKLDANANSGKFGIPHMESIPKRVREHSAFRDQVNTKSPSLRAVWVSEKVPKQPVITHSSWNPPARSKIRDALATMTKSDLEQYMDGNVSFPFTSMKKTSIDDYQPVINRVNELGLKLR
ncbi:PhnD/SsuA/transferrin family substrate-binding protein [Halopenitus persicus]|uniref:Phosphonate transport system substrate-binding protein n=1 Tax=Halopenitus persicus TaxID=1048396 RepID=A0A1H3LIA3_9EURY|nr:PhnD/SsuA/transferrin family substrate-binding protein [Halopenitus persicus]SDY64123.1 phosphonate transport system substrate-binding protein [Halopenitus persicus]